MNSGKNIIKRLISMPIVIPLFILIVISFSLFIPHFFTLGNLKLILIESAPLALVTLGMCLVMLTNGIDLSIGSIVSFIGIIIALFLKTGTNVLITIIISVLLAGTLGFLNGFLISKFKMPSFIITFISLNVFGGLALVLSDNRTIYWERSWFYLIAVKEYLGIPLVFIIAFFVFLIVLFIIHFTPFGVYIYGIGGNEEALRLCGVKTNYYKTLVYITSGIVAGIAGVILTSRVSSGYPLLGQNLPFEAIAAAVLGGVTFIGGRGHPGFAFLSAIMITTLSKGLSLFGLDMSMQYLFIGVIIIIGLSVNKLLKALPIRGNRVYQ